MKLPFWHSTIIYDTPCSSVGTVTLRADGDFVIGTLWLGEDEGLQDEITLVNWTSSSAFVTSNIPLWPNFEPAKQKST